jgi:hypothetical protein
MSHEGIKGIKCRREEKAKRKEHAVNERITGCCNESGV